MERARVGLIGAGPWAHEFTAPMLAGSEELELAGVWARKAARAADVAEAHGADAFDDLDDLVAAADALAFAVAPDAQAELVARVASSGRPLLLEKPVGLTLAQATSTVELLDRHQVPTMLVLTNRFIDPIDELLSAAPTIEPHGARAEFIASGALEGNQFATPWRRREGALLDLGPHVLDALEGVCGPIVGIEAFGDPQTIVEMICVHQSGVTSSAAVSVTTPGEPSGLQVTVWGRHERCSTTVSWSDEEVGPELFRQARERVARGFAEVISTGRSHPLDAHHGLHLQELLESAAASIAARAPSAVQR